MRLLNLYNTQPYVAKEIEEAISNDFLPRSILFSGPSGSSRLTAAFDLAFYLTDNSDKRDILSSSSIIYLPNRNLALQRDAAISLFERQRTQESRLFLVQTVRAILMQYHPAFIPFSPSSLSSYFASAEEIGNAILDFEDSRDYTEKEIKALLKLLKEKMTNQFITRGRKKDTISIDDIRAIQKYFSEGQDEKVVILENLEDANEGAKNSLLKVLEEPNEHSHIILISSNSQRLLQTILSRVWKFNFPSLSAKCVSTLLKDRFSLYGSYDSFDAFLYEEGLSEAERKNLVELSALFSLFLIEGRSMDKSDQEKLLYSLDSSSSFKYFRMQVVKRIRENLLSGKIKADHASRLSSLVNSWSISSDVYNMSQRVVIDSMIREAQFVK